MKTEPTPTLAAVATATPCSAACPKCGSMDIHRHHRASKEEWSRNIGENRKNYETPWVSYVGYSAKALKECITHHCRCCQWKWESDCLPNAKHSNQGSTEKHDQTPAATEGCAAVPGYVADDRDALNGWEILRDAINDGALDAEAVNLMGYGYACAKTRMLRRLRRMYSENARSPDTGEKKL